MHRVAILNVSHAKVFSIDKKDPSESFIATNGKVVNTQHSHIISVSNFLLLLLLPT
jgi:hypothetical protein